MKALEAIIEKGGRGHFREPVKLPQSCRVIVTFRDPPPDVPETALNTTVSGIYAHMFAMRDGETLKIPHFSL